MNPWRAETITFYLSSSHSVYLRAWTHCWSGNTNGYLACGHLHALASVEVNKNRIWMPLGEPVLSRFEQSLLSWTWPRSPIDLTTVVPVSTLMCDPGCSRSLDISYADKCLDRCVSHCIEKYYLNTLTLKIPLFSGLGQSEKYSSITQWMKKHFWNIWQRWVTPSILKVKLGHLGCFHVLAVSAVMNMGVCLFQLWFSQGIFPVVGLLSHMVALFLVFKGISILFCTVAVSIYIAPTAQEGSLFSTSPPDCL